MSPGPPALARGFFTPEPPGTPPSGGAVTEKQYKDPSKKLKIKLPYDPALPLLGIYSKKTEILT